MTDLSCLQMSILLLIDTETVNQAHGTKFIVGQTHGTSTIQLQIIQ